MHFSIFLRVRIVRQVGVPIPAAGIIVQTKVQMAAELRGAQDLTWERLHELKMRRGNERIESRDGDVQAGADGGQPGRPPVAGEDRLPVDAIRNLSETGRDIHWLGAKYSAEVGTGQSVGTLPRC